MGDSQKDRMKWQWPGLLIETEREVGVLDEARSSPRMKRFAHSFPFIVTRSPTQRYLIGQILRKNYATVARQNFVRFAKSFLNGYAKNSGLQCEEENKLKSFCCFWHCRKGFIRGIKGGTSCSVGEVKGGVKMKMEVAAKRSCKD